MKNNKTLTIHMVKTDKGCFITDCPVLNGYDYNYHRTRLVQLYFDGEKPTQSYLKNWYMIKQYPTKIQKQEEDSRTNQRYVLINPEMESKAIPLELSYNELSYDDAIYDLYELKYDIVEGGLKDVEDVDIQVICEVENFEFPPKINYITNQEKGCNKREVQITNENVEHQMLDKLIIPDIMLHSYPCKISSIQLYNIVRQHIKDNINTKYAKITSDYDFCFKVVKIVPLHSPKEFTYTNPFARTKRERNKVHNGVSKYKELEIFEMTHDQKRYENYTPIEPISANNEKELKEKIDTYLKDLIEYINEPLVECEHCQGTGWINNNKIEPHS